MIFDARRALRFALHTIAIAVAVTAGLALVVFLTSPVAWRWPFNVGAVGVLMLFAYCFGRVHEADISTRPTLTISSLPTARTRRRSDV